LVDNADNIAAASVLGLGVPYLQAWDGKAFLGSDGGVALKEGGWPSTKAFYDLRAEYLASGTEGEECNFSVAAKVPVSYFNEKLPGLLDQYPNGLRDYRIAGLYNAEMGVEELTRLGYDAAGVLQDLKTAYFIEDFRPISPEVLGVMAQTYTDPDWRKTAPLALVITRRVISADGTFSEKWILDRLAKTHRVVVGQGENSEDVLRLAAEAKARHGLADILVLAGHGNSQAIVCMSNEPAAFATLATAVHPEGTVVLAACSTAEYVTSGANVATSMQRAMPGRKLFAATRLINGAYINYVPTARKRTDRYRVFMQGSPFMGNVQNPPEPPEAPVGLARRVVSASRIDLSWKATATATSYKVKRSTTVAGPYRTIAIGLKRLSFSDTVLAAGRTYYYTVTAANSGGDGSESTPILGTTLNK
jgi:hypothetical protein